jgi:hypothetical protein
MRYKDINIKLEQDKDKVNVTWYDFKLGSVVYSVLSIDRAMELIDGWDKERDALLEGLNVKATIEFLNKKK